MLVLTRKSEQKIRIGNDIVITVLKVQGDQVSIGIEAPKQLQIMREELLQDGLAEAAERSNKKSLLKQN
jgi:carbon storage regulator